jgi:hypothetical protein
MSTVVAEDIRWEESDSPGGDGSWGCHAYVLFRGDVSPGRIVDWGAANGPNVAVVLGNTSQTFRRVATHSSVEMAKRHLLAITDNGTKETDIAEHVCSEQESWRKLYELLLDMTPGEVFIRKEWGVWNVLRGETYVISGLKFCPFCASSLS